MYLGLGKCSREPWAAIGFHCLHGTLATCDCLRAAQAGCGGPQAQAQARGRTGRRARAVGGSEAGASRARPGARPPLPQPPSARGGGFSSCPRFRARRSECLLAAGVGAGGGARGRASTFGGARCSAQQSGRSTRAIDAGAAASSAAISGSRNRWSSWARNCTASGTSFSSQPNVRGSGLFRRGFRAAGCRRGAKRRGRNVPACRWAARRAKSRPMVPIRPRSIPRIGAESRPRRCCDATAWPSHRRMVARFSAGVGVGAWDTAHC